MGSPIGGPLTKLEGLRRFAGGLKRAFFEAYGVLTTAWIEIHEKPSLRRLN